MSNVLPGEGTDLQLKVSTVFTTIAQVTSIESPEMSRNVIETTALKSAIKTKRGSRQPDMSDLSFHINFDPNEVVTHSLLKAKIQATAPVIDDWKLIYNDGDTTPANDTFSGFLSKFKETGLEEDGNLGADITITLTTVITSTVGVP